MGDIIIIKKKEINIKYLYIYMDQVIFESLNYGNLHFFITINFSEEIKCKKKVSHKIEKLEKKIR